MSQERRPRLDSVVKAIDEGRYDTDLREIMGAIQRRLDARREALEAQVRETFGEDYEIAPKGQAAAKLTWRNPPLKTDTQQERQNLPVPHDFDEEDVIRAEMPEDEPLTDEFESRSPQFGAIEEGEEEHGS